MSEERLGDKNSLEPRITLSKREFLTSISYRKYFRFIPIVIILIAIVMTVFVLKQNTDRRQHAAGESAYDVASVGILTAPLGEIIKSQDSEGAFIQFNSHANNRHTNFGYIASNVGGGDSAWTNDIRTQNIMWKEAQVMMPPYYYGVDSYTHSLVQEEMVTNNLKDAANHNVEIYWFINGYVKQNVQYTISKFSPYVKRFQIWNERISNDGSGIIPVGTSTAYLADGLRWARDANPKAKLYINEYNIEEMTGWQATKSNSYFQIAKQLKQTTDNGKYPNGLIDGVGFQGHFNIYRSVDWTSVKNNIARFNQIGLDVAFTEVDVTTGTTTPNATQLAQQAEMFKQAAIVCSQASMCSTFMISGVSDKHDWHRYWTGQTPDSSLLYDDNFQPKPAYTAVKGVLKF